jgi:hypothetical protein
METVARCISTVSRQSTANQQHRAEVVQSVSGAASESAWSLLPALDRRIRAAQLGVLSAWGELSPRLPHPSCSHAADLSEPLK